MIATDFVYDGERLSDYGMIICSFDGSQDGAVSSGADITFSTAASSGSDIYNLYYTHYEEAYSVTFSICKNPCAADNADKPYLSREDISDLQRWLSRKDAFHKFKIDDPDYANVYWEGSFSCQQYLIGGNVAGLNLTFYTNRPYGRKDELEKVFTLDSAGSFTVYDELNDETGYLYPSMVIQLTSGCDEFTISNSRDTKTFSVKNCKAGEELTINGELLTLQTNKPSHDIARDFNYCFPRIFNSYKNTENIYYVNCPCKVTFKYSPVCKVGL